MNDADMRTGLDKLHSEAYRLDDLAERAKKDGDMVVSEAFRRMGVSLHRSASDGERVLFNIVRFAK